MKTRKHTGPPHPPPRVLYTCCVWRPRLHFSRMSGGGLEERTASEVHATLCELVTTNAAAHPAWSEYAAMLLSPATVAFFEARLSDAKADSNPPSKKRKRDAASDKSPAPVAEVVCEHCGGAVPQISLRVACMDGTTLDVTVPQRGLVREVKRSVGQVSAVLQRLIRR